MDRTVAAMSDFVVGANDDDWHYVGANIGRDFPEPEVETAQRRQAGDPSPDGKGCSRSAAASRSGTFSSFARSTRKR
jgi:prolyl-tRNA synthetase